MDLMRDKVPLRLLSLFCILIATEVLHATVNLPGIDVLTSGFDSASWTSKYRIFTLDEDGEKVYVKSIGKTYVAPKYVSVVTHGAHSKKVEESCVGVSTHFSEYVHTYQSSVSFDVGIETKSFSLGIAAHRDVRTVYEAIVKRGQAIGLSESWWGIYEVTLPPPFLMTSKFSPMFKQTVAYLKRIGTPKSEGEQRIYNQVCCGAGGFGTHYVGSIIVGGRAKITTFVGSSYHKEHSEKTVSSQISIGFEWKKLKLSLSKRAKEYEKKLMEDFKKSSNQKASFQPDLKAIHSDPAPWKKWEAAVVDNPTVVNTSVSSIANLFFDSPEVMAHMQKTIDFYIKFNRAPHFSDVHRPLFNLESVNSNGLAHVVPGLKIVGCGFDATTLSSKHCLFQQPSSALPHTKWSNPYYPDIVYDVPYGFFAINTPESLLLDSTIVMNTIDDYIEKSIYFERHHHHGFLGFGSKDETTTTKKYYRNFYAHNYKLVLSLRQIAWYTLRLSEFPLPPLSKAFKMSLDFLPSVYDPSNPKVVAIYKMFFEAFGTDVVTAADMGGMVWAENWFESCLTKMYSDTCIRHEVKKGWWFVHKHKITEKCDKRIISDFKKYSEYHYEMLGGTAGKIKKADWDKWVLSVKYDPRPVKYTLVPIHYMLSDTHPKKKALVSATYAYLKTSQDKRKKIIDALVAVRPPPAKVCKRITNQVSFAMQNKSINKRTPGMLSSKPSDVLCPFVGYHGAYCPTKYQQSLKSENNERRSLPRGVGLTIDVTTGELKLPALKYDDSPTTWTDPSTRVVYNIPYGVSLSVKGVSSENIPITRVFKTEEQLVSVWETGYKQGNWLGGEFGQSKGILDLYNKFFSKQQATSINQHPQALYKLSLTGQWEKKLNAYVMMALHSLPAKYDSNTYSRFMDTWGTHVAKDTLVGGMFEQQVVMKDCVWKSPYLTGGLTDAQLQSYLKMELAKSSPRDSFYRARRKMHIDHRIGGNPEVKDDKTWIRTLSKNPALVKIYSQVDWATVARKAGAVSSVVANNLQRAIRERMAYRENQRVREKTATKQKRIKELQGPRSVIAMVGHGRRGTISPSLETGKYLTLKGFGNCPPGLSITQSKRVCNTGLYITSWNHFRIREPLRYERNAQGDMRSVRCFDLDSRRRCITHRGPWVRNGCSLQPYANGRERPFHTPVPGHTVVAMVCADCQIIKSGFPRDSTLRCVCPGY